MNDLHMHSSPMNALNLSGGIEEFLPSLRMHLEQTSSSSGETQLSLLSLPQLFDLPLQIAQEMTQQVPLIAETLSLQKISQPADTGKDQLTGNSIGSPLVQPHDEGVDTPNFALAEVGEVEEPEFFVPRLNSPYESGVFTVGETGKVEIEFLYDGGAYQGELAIFSLEGMEALKPGSEAFIQEAARRALSRSEWGHVVISDRTEGARFASSTNAGSFLGVKSFAMRPNDEFGIMLIPNGRVQEVWLNPAISGTKRPLFSMATANPEDGLHVGQIADITGDGRAFAFEDWRVDAGSDRDYDDVVFQVKGATGRAVLLAEVINPKYD